MDFKVTETNKNIIAATIIALGFIVASIIYAYSNRYTTQSFIRVDNWTGKFKTIEKVD